MLGLATVAASIAAALAFVKKYLWIGAAPLLAAVVALADLLPMARERLPFVGAVYLAGAIAGWLVARPPAA